MSGGKSGAMERDGQSTLAIEIPESALALDIQYIPWDLIFPDAEQPRVQADDELKASIAAGGIRQPITVRPRPGAIGQYQIVDGERRWRGAQGVQSSIPCIVRADMEDDAERLRTQLIANTGRPLTPVEEARAMAALMTSRGGSITELAAYLGKPVTTVSQRLNLMQLGPWLELVQRGAIKYTHAAEVLLPYRGCPDAVHTAVIAALHKSFPQGVMPTDGEAFESTDDFRRDVEHLYRAHLYPLTKLKGDVKPIFQTALHDRECSCGGVDQKDWQGKRRYCGNPEWWQPLEKAAKKEERAKQKAEAEKSPAAKTAEKPAESKEPAWERENRLRREFAAGIRAQEAAILKPFVSVIKKASTRPGGALDRYLVESENTLTLPSEEADAIVPRGKNGDDFMRWLAFGDVHQVVTDREYELEDALRELGKAFGVDVAPFIKTAKAAPKDAALAPAAKKKGK